YFGSINNFDRPNFTSFILEGNDDIAYQFRSLSDSYHLIENSFQAPVIINYEGRNEKLLEKLYEQELDRTIFQKLCRYTVEVPLRDIKRLLESGEIQQVADGVYVQAKGNTKLYVPGLGLVTDMPSDTDRYTF
ncbi:MAG: hypothetical protein K6G51_08475, partial [Sphaerochaetaceae bacterium]|nr:hypothetical protein [Sphaerochaetaceae bacterium]